MLLRMAVVQGIVDGRVDRVYRRWAAPRAKAGGRQRTPLGELSVGAVTEVDPSSLTEADAVAAGHPSLADLHAQLASREGTVYRVELAFAGADPRVALRDDVPTGEALATLLAALARKDRRGAWTHEMLALIGANEGVRAQDLADRVGEGKPRFKRRVRQLKELGLTISLERGYALSARGRAALAAMGG